MSNAVRILWDGVVESLDWGSGFWVAEDAGAVAWIGKLAGFDVPREPGGPYSHAWDVQGFADAIAAYERNRAVIDANLPALP